MDLTNAEAAADWLMTPEAVRARCGVIFAAAKADGLEHFALREERLEATADFVVETIRAAYPDLEIPYHSRWRHFSVGGIDRWANLEGRLQALDRRERGRVRFDLAVTSVLLDAGAGADWAYREAGGASYARSEGLGVASFAMFAAGLFSGDPAAPMRADAAGLQELSADALAAGFQATPENPLAGLEGRLGLLRRLGAALGTKPAAFGTERPRVGGLFDALLDTAVAGRLPARAILIAVLEALGGIWPGRESLGGRNLGDTWRHPAVVTADARGDLVPFHKLSQWLSYSLIEPLEEEGGITVSEIDALTGLAEYRNGGLFVDCGVLVPKNSGVTSRAHPPQSPVIVEWRALTVILLDRLADLVRGKLGLDAETFPLAKLLEGGSWAAGRRIAAEKRSGGAPPISLLSDGAVF